MSTKNKEARIVTDQEFHDLLEQLEKKKSKNKPCILAMLDLDHSKKLPVADKEQILHSLADQISDVFTDSIVARIGNDSFAVLLAHTKCSFFDVANFKNQLQNQCNYTFCMGLASYPTSCLEIPELFTIAGEALYAAKKKGTNQIELPEEQPMKLKSCYYRHVQLEKLTELAKKMNKSESYILRRALDDFLRENEK